MTCFIHLKLKLKCHRTFANFKMFKFQDLINCQEFNDKYAKQNNEYVSIKFTIQIIKWVVSSANILHWMHMKRARNSICWIWCYKKLLFSHFLFYSFVIFERCSINGRKNMRLPWHPDERKTRQSDRETRTRYAYTFSWTINT